MLKCEIKTTSFSYVFHYGEQLRRETKNKILLARQNIVVLEDRFLSAEK